MNEPKEKNWNKLFIKRTSRKMKHQKIIVTSFLFSYRNTKFPPLYPIFNFLALL